MRDRSETGMSESSFIDGRETSADCISESREDGAIKAAAASEDWTIGTMLARMGVEPGMYAWDADAEDWGVPEED